jgi:hypothetical protein
MNLAVLEHSATANKQHIQRCSYSPLRLLQHPAAGLLKLWHLVEHLADIRGKGRPKQQVQAPFTPVCTGARTQLGAAEAGSALSGATGSSSCAGLPSTAGQLNALGGLDTQASRQPAAAAQSMQRAGLLPWPPTAPPPTLQSAGQALNSLQLPWPLGAPHAGVPPHTTVAAAGFAAAGSLPGSPPSNTLLQQLLEGRPQSEAASISIELASPGAEPADQLPPSPLPSASIMQAGHALCSGQAGWGVSPVQAGNAPAAVRFDVPMAAALG